MKTNKRIWLYVIGAIILIICIGLICPKIASAQTKRDSLIIKTPEIYQIGMKALMQAETDTFDYHEIVEKKTLILKGNDPEFGDIELPVILMTVERLYVDTLYIPVYDTTDVPPDPPDTVDVRINKIFAQTDWIADNVFYLDIWSDSEIALQEFILKSTGGICFVNQSTGNYRRHMNIIPFPQPGMPQTQVKLSLTDGLLQYNERFQIGVQFEGDHGSLEFGVIVSDTTVYDDFGNQGYDLAEIIVPTKGIIGKGKLTVFWNPVSALDLAGYKVYYDTVPGRHFHHEDAGLKTSWSIWLDIGSVYYFAVTAYDLSGNESVFSLEVSYDLK